MNYFPKTVGISEGTNCAMSLTGLFLLFCEKEFSDRLIKDGKRDFARGLNLLHHYIDDFNSFNNIRFMKFISDIYPKELTVAKSHSLLLLLIKTLNESSFA